MILAIVNNYWPSEMYFDGEGTNLHGLQLNIVLGSSHWLSRELPPRNWNHKIQPISYNF